MWGRGLCGIFQCSRDGSSHGWVTPASPEGQGRCSTRDLRGAMQMPSAQVSGFQISPAGPGPHTTTLTEGSDSPGALQLYLSSPATQLYLPPTPGVRAPIQAHTHPGSLLSHSPTGCLLAARCPSPSLCGASGQASSNQPTFRRHCSPLIFQMPELSPLPQNSSPLGNFPKSSPVKYLAFELLPALGTTWGTHQPGRPPPPLPSE